MLNVTEDVLSALVSNQLDHTDIVKKLAVYHPEVLLQILHLDDLTYMVQKAYNKDGKANKVAAIKKYRELAGTDLRDAKRAVEKMIDSHQIYVVEVDDNAEI